MNFAVWIKDPSEDDWYLLGHYEDERDATLALEGALFGAEIVTGVILEWEMTEVD